MNNKRIKHLIYKSIKELDLNLAGYTVYTEAGTGIFSIPPVIAVLAGAKEVFAISKDCSYGTATEAYETMEAILDDKELLKRIVKVNEKKADHLIKTDILTNLGHVRPIDKWTINNLNSSKAVIPYMCESWEVREGDVNLEYSYKNNIPVMGTNEDHDKVNCFENCGIIAVKLLLEAGLEIKKNKIAIYSADKFGEVILKSLESLNADVRLFNNNEQLINDNFCNNLDALIVADYISRDEIIGQNGVIDLTKMATKSPDITIIPFSGKINGDYIIDNNVQMYPKVNLTANRMVRTLAYVGPKPVVGLITGGLKVGQIMRDIKCVTEDIEKIILKSQLQSKYEGLAQKININE